MNEQQQAKESDFASQFSHEIILEDMRNDTQSIISEPEWHVKPNTNLSPYCLKFVFIPLTTKLDPTCLRFVIHDEFYLPRMMQPFPAYAASRGCFFRVCQLPTLMTASSLLFSVLHNDKGSLHPLLVMRYQDNDSSNERPNSLQHGKKWNLYIRYAVDIYNNSREVIQATFRMALPRNDYPIHAQRSFMALHNPVLDTDRKGNQFLQHADVILKPGHSTRLQYDWHCVVQQQPINYMNSSSLAEWISQHPRDAQWLENERGIEKNHHQVGEICAKLRHQSSTFWDLVRLLFIELRKRIQVEQLLDEKGCAWALEHGKGDCTEFAASFAAVMRNLGIPTKLVSGLKFNALAKAWNRHAWTEVRAPTGEWIPIDPFYQAIGFHPHYLPIYVGNWIKEEHEVEFSIKIHSPRHVDETMLRKQLRISTWIEGEVKRKSNDTKKSKRKVLFLEE